MNVLVTSAALAGSAIPAVASVPNIEALSPDAKIIALSVEILRLCAVFARVRKERLEPLEHTFMAIIHDGEGTAKERYDAAWVFSRESGRDEVVSEMESLDKQATLLFDRMKAIPTLTQVGRAAKVRCLVVFVLGDGWRGPSSELDWDKDETRALLGEFAGMNSGELAAI